jgi:hypothetical protein
VQDIKVNTWVEQEKFKGEVSVAGTLNIRTPERLVPGWKEFTSFCEGGRSGIRFACSADDRVVVITIEQAAKSRVEEAIVAQRQAGWRDNSLIKNESYRF